VKNVIVASVDPQKNGEFILTGVVIDTGKKKIVKRFIVSTDSSALPWVEKLYSDISSFLPQTDKQKEKWDTTKAKVIASATPGINQKSTEKIKKDKTENHTNSESLPPVYTDIAAISFAGTAALVAVGGILAGSMAYMGASDLGTSIDPADIKARDDARASATIGAIVADTLYTAGGLVGISGGIYILLRQMKIIAPVELSTFSSESDNP